MQNKNVRACLRLLFLLTSLSAPLSFAQENRPAEATTERLEQCLALDETDIRGDIDTLAQAFFEAEVNAVDLPRIVDRKWFELGVPNLL